MPESDFEVLAEGGPDVEIKPSPISITIDFSQREDGMVPISDDFVPRLSALVRETGMDPYVSFILIDPDGGITQYVFRKAH